MDQLHQQLTEGQPEVNVQEGNAALFVKMMSRKKTVEEQQDQFMDLDFFLDYDDEESGSKLSQVARLKAERELLKSPTVPRALNYPKWLERWNKRCACQRDEKLRQAMVMHAHHLHQVDLAYGWKFAERYNVEVTRAVSLTRTIQLSVIHGMALTAAKLNAKADRAHKKSKK